MTRMQLQILRLQRRYGITAAHAENIAALIWGMC